MRPTTARGGVPPLRSDAQAARQRGAGRLQRQHLDAQRNQSGLALRLRRLARPAHDPRSPRASTYDNRDPTRNHARRLRRRARRAASTRRTTPPVPVGNGEPGLAHLGPAAIRWCCCTAAPEAGCIGCATSKTSRATSCCWCRISRAPANPPSPERPITAETHRAVLLRRHRRASSVPRPPLRGRRLFHGRADLRAIVAQARRRAGRAASCWSARPAPARRAPRWSRCKSWRRLPTDDGEARSASQESRHPDDPRSGQDRRRSRSICRSATPSARACAASTSPNRRRCRNACLRLKGRLAGIWGEHDATAAPYLAERREKLRAFQPDATFDVIPGAGHWVQYEAAAPFNQRVRQLLK